MSMINEWNARTKGMNKNQRRMYFVHKLGADERNQLNAEVQEILAKDPSMTADQVLNSTKPPKTPPKADREMVPAGPMPVADTAKTYTERGRQVVDATDLPINIEGQFNPRVKPTQPTLSNMDDPTALAKELARQGDLSAAQEVLRTAQQSKEALDMFNRDLTPEALFADRIRAKRYRHAGAVPRNELIETGQFGGETPDRFELERQREADVLSGVSGVQGIKSQKERDRIQRSVLGLRRKEFQNNTKRLQRAMINDIASLKMLTDNFKFKKKTLESKNRMDRISLFNKSLLGQANILMEQIKNGEFGDDKEGEAKAAKVLQETLDKLRLVEKAILE